MQTPFNTDIAERCIPDFDKLENITEKLFRIMIKQGVITPFTHVVDKGEKSFFYTTWEDEENEVLGVTYNEWVNDNQGTVKLVTRYFKVTKINYTTR